MKCFLFWLASWTWGIIMTFIGFVIALALLITGHKPHRFHYFVYFEVGDCWGGFNCGCFFVTDKSSSINTKQHESGHGLQNIILGVFMPFLVSIPSMIRYWYREYLVHSGKKHYGELSDYYGVWFEKQASELGEKYFN